MAKPIAQYASIAMPYTMKFIVVVWAAFLARVNPVSTRAKPACMNITRNPATSVQTKLIATVLAAAAVFAACAKESAAGTPCAARANGVAAIISKPSPTARLIRSPERGVEGCNAVFDFVQKMHKMDHDTQPPIQVGKHDCTVNRA